MSSPRSTVPSITPFGAVRLVAGRELSTRLRTRAFVLGTAVILAVLIGFFALQATVLSGSSTTTIGLSGQATGIASTIQQRADQLGIQVETKRVSNLGQGRQSVRSGDLEVLVSGETGNLHAFVESELDEQVRVVLTGIAQSDVLRSKLAETGLNPTVVLTAVSTTQVEVTAFDPADPAQTQRKIIGMIIVVLMFGGIATYGQLVTQGVVEEKSTRVVEILLSTIRPWHLMLGKVIGLGLVGLIQLTIIGAAGLVLASTSGLLVITGAATGMFLWGLLWYIVGFFLYATIFGAAGSLVSRQEEVQSVTTPVLMTLVGGYVVGFNVVLQNPDGTAAMVLSLVPVLAPIAVPGRIAVDAVAGWEIALSIALTIGAIVVFTWLGSKIYRNAVLHTGSRVKLADTLRA